ncbi:MAG: precorrin-4 C(11)-methyltransferase [Chloroflexi bacterium]|nr:MAG: precorrin-4 C(11)-methyltransferase [Chloroflexota bacterium]
MNEKQIGRVYFVGAGAGDPGLLTLKGRDLIAAADVIVYAGSLVNPAILAHAKPDAEKRSSAGMKLDEQVAVMETAVSNQKTVVRLHTGDPSIYGAIFEQMRQLRAAGVPYEIVPGVSSGLAAAAALGIEYTLPGDTQTVIFTRQSGRTPVPDRENLRSLAAHRSSLVIFLSVGMVDTVVNELYAAGYTPETPVAVAFRVSWPDEHILRGTLGNIAQQVHDAEITHHALIVVSPALDMEKTAVAPDSHLYGTAFADAKRQSAIAVVTLTRNGTATGQRLLHQLPDTVLYAPERFVETAERVKPYRISVRQVLQSAFQQHHLLVCVMASGIVVREIAPLLRSKHQDPGVVVLDEAGRHAISLLSGHKGGANALAKQVASLLGGTAVLTTSSDVQGLPAVDLLGQEWGWQIERAGRLTAVSAALVNGQPIGVVQEAGDESWLPNPLPAHMTRYETVAAMQAAAPVAALVISPKQLPATLFAAVPNTVVYRPPCLTVGVGCNRGTDAAEIEAAIKETVANAGLVLDCVTAVATIEDKADEAGILQTVAKHDWPLTIYSRAEIGTVENLPNPSKWAQKALGVAGVAEPAAMLAANAPTLLVEKQKFANTTVAIALKQGNKA